MQSNPFNLKRPPTSWTGTQMLSLLLNNYHFCPLPKACCSVNLRGVVESRNKPSRGLHGATCEHQLVGVLADLELVLLAAQVAHLWPQGEGGRSPLFSCEKSHTHAPCG